ncbi:MAG: pilus assembly PilX family protein [Rubrivivax sp.]|jgi:type IV pilus assembly protein PilX
MPVFVAPRLESSRLSGLTRCVRATRRRTQQGVTIVVTLILLVVMLMGGLALARLTEVSTLAAGNAAYHEAAVQASEVGVNTAFAAVQALTNEEANLGNWYFAQTLATDAEGLPAAAVVNAGPAINVGIYTVRYVVDRLCTGAAVPPDPPVVTDPVRQCLNKSRRTEDSAVAGKEPPDPVTARQFRITVQVTGPKGTQTWVQSLMTRG